MSSNTPKSPFDYSAWLIDLDGTLYHHNPVRAMMTIELALWGRPAIKTLRAFRREHEQLRKLETVGANDPFTAQICRTAERLRQPEAGVADLVNEWMINRPGKWLRRFRRRPLLAAIKRFRAQGGRTAIVSDYPARRKLAALQAAELFDAVVASGEAGGPSELKPRPDGFLLAARQLQLSSSDCLVIGDRLDADGEAARRAGMAFQHAKIRWPRR